jgi:hypothetical protein
VLRGLGKGEGEVGEQRTADLDGSAPVNVERRDDLSRAGECDAVPVSEFLHEGVDTAGIEIVGSVQDPRVGLGRGAAEEDVDVAVAAGLEDSHGVIGEDTAGLVPVVDDGDDVVVDPCATPGSEDWVLLIVSASRCASTVRSCSGRLECQAR